MRATSLFSVACAAVALTLAGCATPVTTTSDKGTAPAAVASSAGTTKVTTKASVPPAPQTPKDVGTVSQRNALRSAQSYIEVKGFSKAGLIEQLTSSYGDGFSKADAIWAVAHLAVDWNEQAVRAGKTYLDTKGFSRSGLIQQLSSAYGDKFTTSEATHAADKLGLK